MVVVRRGATLLGFTEHHERTDRSPLEAAADGVTIRFAGRIGELLVPSTGYAEMELPAADRDALVAAIERANIPRDDGAFAFASLMHTTAGPSDQDAAEEHALVAAALAMSLTDPVPFSREREACRFDRR